MKVVQLIDMISVSMKRERKDIVYSVLELLLRLLGHALSIEK